MTLHFKDPEPPTPPSLACRLELDGRIRWRELSACRLTYDDNEAELIPVYITKKRDLHVVTDQMLSAMRDAKADMETAPQGRLSGLNLNLYPI